MLTRLMRSAHGEALKLAEGSNTEMTSLELERGFGLELVENLGS